MSITEVLAWVIVASAFAALVVGFAWTVIAGSIRMWRTDPKFLLTAWGMIFASALFIWAAIHISHRGILP